MPGIFATAGAKVFIGNVEAPKNSDHVIADFNGQSWLEIGWAENLGAFGDEASEITFDAIGEGRVQKLKGTRNAGTMAMVFGVDASDDGQAAVKAAETDSLDYAFRVNFNDAPEGGTPSQRFFIAKVMSAREVLDGANNVVRLNVNVAINSNIVKIDAA
jgi:hypothetical protein